MSVIPHSRPWIAESDRAAVTALLDSAELASGGTRAVFEEAIARWLGVRTGTGVAVGSGPAALHLALLALNVHAGDEIVLPTYACRTLLDAVHATGATPVPCDVGQSWVVTPECVAPYMSPRTRAIIVPHLYGIFARAAAFKVFGVPVIEDFAQAFDAEGARTLQGDIGICSFHASTCLTTGEGGMALASNPELAARLRAVRDGAPGRLKPAPTTEGAPDSSGRLQPALTTHADEHDRRGRLQPAPTTDGVPDSSGRLKPAPTTEGAPDSSGRLQPAPTTHADEHDRRGRLQPAHDAPRVFSPMSDLAAALGLSQLRRYHEALVKRRQLALRYRAALEPHVPEVMARQPLEGTMHFRFPISVRGGFDACHARFARQGVSVRRGVDRLLHRELGRSDDRFPVAVELFNTTVSLPIYPSLSDADFRRSADAALDVCADVAATVAEEA